MDIKNSGLDLVNYDIWYEPVWFIKYFYLIIIALVCLSVLIIVFVKIKNKKIKQLSGIELFCYKLDQLHKVQDIKKFYINLILNLKEYLTGVLGRDFYIVTDDEFPEILKNLNFSSEFIEKIKPSIHRGQMAKFAEANVSREQALDDLVSLKATVLSWEKIRNT